MTFSVQSKPNFFGFLTTSQITLGIQKVIGANPNAPKKPSKSAATAGAILLMGNAVFTSKPKTCDIGPDRPYGLCHSHC